MKAHQKTGPSLTKTSVGIKRQTTQKFWLEGSLRRQTCLHNSPLSRGSIQTAVRPATAMFLPHPQWRHLVAVRRRNTRSRKKLRLKHQRRKKRRRKSTKSHQQILIEKVP